MTWRRPKPNEVTLFDTRAGGAVDAPPRRRYTLVKATLVPALIAGVAGALVAPLFGGSRDGGAGPATAMAADLAREAARPGSLPPLVPVVERGGEPRLAAHDNASG